MKYTCHISVILFLCCMLWKRFKPALRCFGTNACRALPTMTKRSVIVMAELRAFGIWKSPLRLLAISSSCSSPQTVVQVHIHLITRSTERLQCLKQISTKLVGSKANSLFFARLVRAITIVLNFEPDAYPLQV